MRSLRPGCDRSSSTRRQHKPPAPIFASTLPSASHSRKPIPTPIGGSPQTRSRARSSVGSGSAALQSARRDPHSTMVPLFIAALNDAINLSIEERAVLTTHIPDVVIIGLLLIAFIASAMMGYGFGRQGQRALDFQSKFCRHAGNRIWSGSRPGPASTRPDSRQSGAVAGRPTPYGNNGRAVRPALNDCSGS